MHDGSQNEKGHLFTVVLAIRLVNAIKVVGMTKVTQITRL